MADLNIPNLNMKSDKYIFKKKLSLRRKSKKRLFKESAFLFVFSLLLVYINYLIPNKISLVQNIPTTFNKSLILIIELSSKIFEIFLAVFIFVSLIIALIMMVGSFYRLFKVAKRKSRQLIYK